MIPIITFDIDICILELKSLLLICRYIYLFMSCYARPGDQVAYNLCILGTKNANTNADTASNRHTRFQPIRSQSFRANQSSAKPGNPHFALTKRGSESGTAPQQMKVGSLEHLLGYFHLTIFMNVRRTFLSYPLLIPIEGLQY